MVYKHSIFVSYNLNRKFLIMYIIYHIYQPYCDTFLISLWFEGAFCIAMNLHELANSLFDIHS